MPFTKGHPSNTGKTLPESWRKNISLAKLGSKNPMYRGSLLQKKCEKCEKPFSCYPPYSQRFCSHNCANFKGPDAKYIAKHQRIYRKWGKAAHCEACGEGKTFDWANISGKYGTDTRADWVQLCRGCHVKYDRYGYSLKDLGYGN